MATISKFYDLPLIYFVYIPIFHWNRLFPNCVNICKYCEYHNGVDDFEYEYDDKRIF